MAILGAGPAGLGLAWKLATRRSFDVTLLERNSVAGGNAGSFEFAGQRVDYGSHRLHPACAPGILSDIRGMLGADLLDRPRHGRIRLRGRWLHFPLKPADLALHAPPSFVAGVLADRLRRPAGGAPESFASLLERGLGRTICRDFYFPYARKIWGMEPEALDAEQARRRVGASSLAKIARQVLAAEPGFKPRGAGRFFYPRQGYGQIGDGYQRVAREAGTRILFEADVRRVEAGGVRFAAGGVESRIDTRLVLSTIPIPALVRLLDPPPPGEVLAAAAALRYRAMILVYLALDAPRFTEFDAHYFPGADVHITRLSEPKNYSLEGPRDRTVLCAELPCSVEDSWWRASDQDLGKLVAGDLERAGVPIRAPVAEIATRRLAQAYPVYALDYRRHFDRLDGWLAEVTGVLSLGRQGLFVHDNTHHTLAMAYAAAECVAPDGAVDRRRWSDRRRAFESNVVED